MNVAEEMDVVKDWCSERARFGNPLKGLGISNVILSIVLVTAIGGASYLEKYNKHAYRKAFDALDHSRVVSFVSQEQCIGRGYSVDVCKASFDRAKQWAEGLGTQVSYSNAPSYVKIHGFAHSFSQVTKQNLMRLTSQVPVTEDIQPYIPPVIGWLAESDNLENAVPLYPSPVSKAGVRADGKQFSLGDGK